MSSIAFTTLSGKKLAKAHVRGPERHMAGSWVASLFETATHFDSDFGAADSDKWILDLLPADCYLRRRPFPNHEFFRDLRMWTRNGSEPSLNLNGKSVAVFSLQLNTALAVGNDAMRLMARLHGQCEIHAWVDGPNRAWMAKIIKDGRSTGVLRSEMGWESVADLLLSADDQPMVTSYSVCESFPNPGPDAEGMSEDEHDAWYGQSEAKQWESAIESLRPRHEGTLEMRPDQWAFPDYHFGGEPLTGFDIHPPLK